jgi:RHS repeat-associated protein
VSLHATRRWNVLSFCQERAYGQSVVDPSPFSVATRRNGCSERWRTAKVRDRAGEVSVARYYDPTTGQFLSFDPVAALTEAPYSYVADDPLNGVDPSGLCSDVNPFCPITTAANWVSREVSNHALAAAETLDCISDIVECTNTPEGHANYVAGIENSLLQLGGVAVSIPEPYPCAAAGSYTAGELLPYMVGAAASGLLLADGAEAAAIAAEEAAATEELTPFLESNLAHIFREAPGHLANDTLENRLLLQNAVNPDNYVSTNPVSGAATYRELLPNGAQVWVTVRSGAITNGGVNQVPR